MDLYGCGPFFCRGGKDLVDGLIDHASFPIGS
jgi:hypothetical protein